MDYGFARENDLCSSVGSKLSKICFKCLNICAWCFPGPPVPDEVFFKAYCLSQAALLNFKVLRSSKIRNSAGFLTLIISTYSLSWITFLWLSSSISISISSVPTTLLYFGSYEGNPSLTICLSFYPTLTSFFSSCFSSRFSSSLLSICSSSYSILFGGFFGGLPRPFVPTTVLVLHIATALSNDISISSSYPSLSSLSSSVSSYSTLLRYLFKWCAVPPSRWLVRGVSPGPLGGLPLFLGAPEGGGSLSRERDFSGDRSPSAVPVSSEEVIWVLCLFLEGGLPRFLGWSKMFDDIYERY